MVEEYEGREPASAYGQQFYHCFGSIHSGGAYIDCITMFCREDWEGADAEKKTEHTMRRNCQRTQHNNFGGKGD
jgi:hypothetical protein